MERRRDGGDSGGDIPTEHDESLDGAEEDSIFTLDLIDLWVRVRVYFPVSCPPDPVLEFFASRPRYAQAASASTVMVKTQNWFARRPNKFSRHCRSVRNVTDYFRATFGFPDIDMSL